MKIRNGFVSNSSSSSFIVFFPHEIKTREELDKLIITENDERNIKNNWSEYFLDTRIEERIKKTYQGFLNESRGLNMTFEQFRIEAIKYIFRDIQEQKPNDYFHAIVDWFGWDYHVDENGILHTWNDMEFSNITELKSALDKIGGEVDWDQPDADEKYEELQQYESLENIKELIEEIDSNLNNNVFYTFTFSDESGSFFAIMEHNDIFGDLKTMKESHH